MEWADCSLEHGVREKRDLSSSETQGKDSQIQMKRGSFSTFYPPSPCVMIIVILDIALIALYADPASCQRMSAYCFDGPNAFVGPGTSNVLRRF